MVGGRKGEIYRIGCGVRFSNFPVMPNISLSDHAGILPAALRLLTIRENEEISQGLQDTKEGTMPTADD